MATLIERKIENLKAMFQNIPVDSMMVMITERNKATIEDKNIQQLDAGIDGDGNPIEPPYAPLTVEIKKHLGQPFDRVTLENEGFFRKGIKANVMATGFEMIGTDPKTPKLLIKYGGKVLNLTKESKAELSQEVYKPEMMFELRSYFKING